LSQEIQAIGRDVEGTNTYNEFIKNITYIDGVYGHYKLKIPKDWVKISEYYHSDDHEEYSDEEEDEGPCAYRVGARSEHLFYLIIS
jgi:hypothetical protein